MSPKKGNHLVVLAVAIHNGDRENFQLHNSFFLFSQVVDSGLRPAVLDLLIIIYFFLAYRMRKGISFQAN